VSTALRDVLRRLRPDAGPATSVRSVLAASGFPPAVSLRDVDGAASTVRLRFGLNDATCAGWCELVVTPDGSVGYAGHVHNSGAVDLRYSVVTSVPVPGGPVLLGRQGSVSGTFGFGSRDDDWRQDGRSEFIARQWPQFRAGTRLARSDFGANVGPFEILTTIVGGGSGVWVFGLP
jgi:hypothetical protein